MIFLETMRFVDYGQVGFSGNHAVPSEKVDMPKQNNSLANPTVFIETADSNLEIASGDNLLDALLDSGHEIDYQCRGGYCGACRTTVISGEVEYDELPLAHVNHDEILPCCCRVKESLRLDVKLRQIDEEKQGDLF